MRGIKNLVWVFLIALLMGVSLAGVGKSSPEIVLYIDPEYSIEQPGESFTVFVKAGQVPATLYQDVWLAEFYIRWNASLLDTDVDKINPGDVAPYLEKIHIEIVNTEEGWLHVVVGRPEGNKEGLSGTVQLAKITFGVKEEGSCDLEFYDNSETVDTEPRLLSTYPGDLPRTVKNSYFSTVAFPHDVAVSSVTLSKSVVTIGGSVSVTVNVTNQGTESETFAVTVYYDNETVGTPQTVTLGPGATQLLTFTWNTGGVVKGAYTVRAKAEVVSGEIDTSDNERIGGTVTVQEWTGPNILLYVSAAVVVVAALLLAVYMLKRRKPKPT